MANTNKYFKFKYRPEQDLVEIDRIINIGDVVPAYSRTVQGGEEIDTGGMSQDINVWATNISTYKIYRPGLYIIHQDYESRTASSKPQNMKQMLTPNADTPRDPFASVVFEEGGERFYFDNYNGTKNNPIRVPSVIGELILDKGLICLPIGKTINFWLRIKDTSTIVDEEGNLQLQKELEDGKWGFALRMTGDICG